MYGSTSSADPTNDASFNGLERSECSAVSCLDVERCLRELGEDLRKEMSIQLQVATETLLREVQVGLSSQAALVASQIESFRRAVLEELRDAATGPNKVIRAAADMSCDTTSPHGSSQTQLGELVLMHGGEDNALAARLGGFGQQLVRAPPRIDILAQGVPPAVERQDSVSTFKTMAAPSVAVLNQPQEYSMATPRSKRCSTFTFPTVACGPGESYAWPCSVNAKGVRLSGSPVRSGRTVTRSPSSRQGSSPVHLVSPTVASQSVPMSCVLRSSSQQLLNQRLELRSSSNTPRGVENSAPQPCGYPSSPLGQIVKSALVSAAINRSLSRSNVGGSLGARSLSPLVRGGYNSSGSSPSLSLCRSMGLLTGAPPPAASRRTWK